LTALLNHVMSIGLSAVPFGGFRVQSAGVCIGLDLERQKSVSLPPFFFPSSLLKGTNTLPHAYEQAGEACPPFFYSIKRLAF
jgi:hypothetical protein